MAFILLYFTTIKLTKTLEFSMVRVKALILLTFLSTSFFMLTGCGQKSGLVKTKKDNLLIDTPLNEKAIEQLKSLNVVSEKSQ